MGIRIPRNDQKNYLATHGTCFWQSVDAALTAETVQVQRRRKSADATSGPGSEWRDVE